MTLYEVTNGSTGESYVRVYVWANNEARALELAAVAFQKDKKESNDLSARALFSDGALEFSTVPSDSGWGVDV